jgi:hypothetical protein
MASRRRDEVAPAVGVFWDYEVSSDFLSLFPHSRANPFLLLQNIRFPSDYPAHTALATLRQLALSKGAVGGPRQAYMDTELERGGRTSHLRADLQQAGWTVTDVPHDGKKDGEPLSSTFSLLLPPSPRVLTLPAHHSRRQDAHGGHARLGAPATRSTRRHPHHRRSRLLLVRLLPFLSSPAQAHLSRSVFSPAHVQFSATAAAESF